MFYLFYLLLGAAIPNASYLEEINSIDAIEIYFVSSILIPILMYHNSEYIDLILLSHFAIILAIQLDTFIFALYPFLLLDSFSILSLVVLFFLFPINIIGLIYYGFKSRLYLSKIKFSGKYSGFRISFYIIVLGLLGFLGSKLISKTKVVTNEITHFNNLKAKGVRCVLIDFTSCPKESDYSNYFCMKIKSSKKTEILQIPKAHFTYEISAKPQDSLIKKPFSIVFYIKRDNKIIDQIKMDTY